MSYQEKQAFITGATGFVGGALAERLVEQGWTVTALVRPQSETAKLESLGISLVPGDVCQSEGLAEAMAGAGVVFHCAALTGVGHRNSDVHRVIAQGTNNLLDAAHTSGVQRFVYVSSVAVYELSEANDCDERHALLSSSIDPYAQAKIAAEKACFEACRAGKLEATIVRPVFIYGPGDRPGGFLPELVNMISKGKFKLIGGGDHQIPLVYISDLTDLLIRCACQPEAAGEIYNASSKESPSWKELAKVLCNELDLKMPGSVSENLVMPVAGLLELLARYKLLRTLPVSKAAVRLLSRPVTFSVEKAGRDLGYVSTTGFREGMKNCLPMLRSIN